MSGPTKALNAGVAVPTEMVPWLAEHECQIVTERFLQEQIELHDAAMWVVLTWDTMGTQHHTMPALRRALGLPGERPTPEEAAERMKAWMTDLIGRGGD